MLPDAGDIYRVDFDPIRGTEQAERRPALFITDNRFHRISKRAVVLPITGRDRPWAFHYPLPPGLKVRGFVIADQIRVIDIQNRVASYLDHIGSQELTQMRSLLGALLQIPAIS